MLQVLGFPVQLFFYLLDVSFLPLGGVRDVIDGGELSDERGMLGGSDRRVKLRGLETLSRRAHLSILFLDSGSDL